MIAVIDIGSNSVRLLLWADGNVLKKKLKTTRLGENLFSGGCLSEVASVRTLEAVEEFVLEGQALGAKVYLFATEAVRAAKNGAQFTEKIRERCGLSVDIVSGEREAHLGLFGALKGADGGMVDVGGASTEIAFQEAGKMCFSVSLKLGAVRLFESCHEDRAALDAEIDGQLNKISIPAFSGKIYAIGGTATSLAAVKLGLGEYDGERVRDCLLTRSDLEEWSRRLFSLTPKEREAIPGMDKRRTDIIASGTYLLKKVMQKISAQALYVSDSDNLEGYLYERGLL